MNAVLLAAALGLMAPNGTGRIFLNGVPIDGVRGQEFANATVRIDEQGRVLINAPDYEVAPPAETRTLKPSRLAPGEGALAIFQSLNHGKTGITVQVLVNGKTIYDEFDPLQGVVDIGAQLMSGKNTLEVRVGRDKGVGAMEVVIALGGIRGTNIELTEQLVSEKVDVFNRGLKVFQVELTR